MSRREREDVLSCLYEASGWTPCRKLTKRSSFCPNCAQREAIAAALIKANAPIADAYACQSCGRRDGLDAVLPNKAWERICRGERILCLWCIDKRCEEEGISPSLTLHFAGRAAYGTSQSEADAEHIDRMLDEIERLKRDVAALDAALAALDAKEPA